MKNKLLFYLLSTTTTYSFMTNSKVSFGGKTALYFNKLTGTVR